MTKTISIKRRLALLLALAFTCVAQGWAYESYSAYLTAKVSSSSTGKGLVYVSDSKTDDSSVEYKDTAGYSQSSVTQGGTVTFYAKAKASQGYYFRGWAKTDNGNIESTDNPYAVQIPVSTNTNLTNYQVVYANFDKIPTITVTFSKPEHGSYTIMHGTTSVSGYETVTTDEKFTLKATPETGYMVYGWYTTTDGGATKSYFSTEATVTDYMFTEDATVGCEFVTTSTPKFIVVGKTTPYGNLNEAIKAAGNNGVVAMKSDVMLEGNYTIPSGVTLLIPFDDDNTVYGTEGPKTSNTGKATPSAFKTLTLSKGSSITVEGLLSVSAQMYSAGGGQWGGGGVLDKYGHIKMEDGSAITVKSGGSLCAWGYVSGSEGLVTVESGGYVYEGFQINDFRGGTATSAMKNNVFPFNQYYVQNIESPMTLKYGAVEYVFGSLFAAKSCNDTGDIVFIGTGGLFSLASESSTITKSYDAANDRQVYVIDGDASLNSISMKVAGLTVSSSNYVLPITNNLTITQKSGTLTVNSDCALLPGAEATIAEGASLNIASGKSLYVYDAAEWGEYAGAGNTVRPVTYTVAAKKDRSKTTLEDSEIKVQGTLTANGNLYTTATGAAVKCENGTGKVVFTNAAPSNTTTYQYTQSGKSVTEKSIDVTSAKLQNADGTYIETAGSAAGTTFYYGVDKDGNTTWVSDEASTDMTTMANKLLNVPLVEASTTVPTTYSSNVYVTYTRTFKTGWNALVLPFATTVEALGADEVVEFTGSTGDKSSVTMNFHKVTALEANKPYMVWFESDPQELHFVAPVVPADQPTTVDSNEAFDFVGSFIALGKKWETTSPIKKGDYIVSASGLTRAKGGNNLSAFRAYFRAYEGMQDAKIGMAINDDEVTGIKAIEFENMLKGDDSEAVGNGTMYNLSGQKVDGSYKGIVIQNGKKILMK